MSRARHWLKRYWLPELVGTATLLLTVGVVMISGGGLFASAILAPWGENIGYYTCLLVRETRAELRRSNHSTPAAALVGLRNISLEFGPAELIDAVLVRPALMYAIPQVLGSVAVGVVLAKIAADVIFYMPVIASYEMRRTLLERRQLGLRQSREVSGRNE